MKSSMDIVDSQIHFGPGQIDETLAGMNALGISAVLADEFWGLDNWGPGYKLAGGGYRVTSPTTELASWLHPDRFSYVLRVDRLDPEVLPLVRIARDAPNLRAIRMLPGLTAEELRAFAEGAYDPVLAQAEALGLPCFFFIPGRAELVGRYLEKFPGLTIIVDHCGMPMESGVSFLDAETPDADTPSDGADLRAFQAVLDLAEWPNARLKWSHAQGMFGVRDYPFPALWPHLRRAIDAFGADRIMWASDIGGNQTGETWGELLHCLRDCAEFTDDEKAWLLGKTVRTALDWPAGSEVAAC
ncbi:amidohydrolase family protein [Croceicoccus ponticola]|uniref:amidohydrolase family protein n=1 Tax=Croceicoccus ponticola TaxID=2217664 RepID=UPI0013E34518|nr:amidohydrolase family protein [Croceicoccus ponticola]